MKQTYMNPEMEVIELKTKQVLLDSSPIQFGSNPASITGDEYDD